MPERRPRTLPGRRVRGDGPGIGVWRRRGPRGCQGRRLRSRSGRKRVFVLHEALHHSFAALFPFRTIHDFRTGHQTVHFEVKGASMGFRMSVFVLVGAFACGGAPSSTAPAAPTQAKVDPATLPPLPRSSIAAVLLHRQELALRDDQVKELQELDEKLAARNVLLREGKPEGTAAGSQPSSGTTPTPPSSSSSGRGHGLRMTGANAGSGSGAGFGRHQRSSSYG